MSLCYRESVTQDGTCVPATAPGRTSGGVSNAEEQARMSLPSVAELGNEEASLSPWGAAAENGSRNFMAEIMAEEQAKRLARGENWLDLPKEGFPTGRAWAEERKAALGKEIRDAQQRTDRLQAAYSEQYHILTDADVAGRLMNRDGSDVHQKLAAALDAHTRAFDHLNEARLHNDLDPDWTDYRVLRSKAEMDLADALRDLDEGEKLLGLATGAAQDRAGNVVTGLQVVETVSKTAVGAGIGLATGGQSLLVQSLAGAAFQGSWESYKQASELAHLGRDVTADDRRRSAGKIGAAAGFGALGAVIPGTDESFSKGAAVAVAGAKGAVLGSAQNTARNAIDGKDLDHGLGGTAGKSATTGVLGHFVKGALKK
jgi:hypothetical protein